MSDRTLRYNEGKLRFHLLPASWIKALVEVFEYGAQKYAPFNWQKSLNTQDHDSVVIDRLDSLMRHVHAWRQGEQNDTESNIHHMTHVAWNALMIAWYDYNKGNASSALSTVAAQTVNDTVRKVTNKFDLGPLGF